jgi:hypothetical protein
MDPVSAIANGLGELFGWFSAISGNKLADKEAKISDDLLKNKFYQSMDASSQRLYLTGQMQAEKEEQAKKMLLYTLMVLAFLLSIYLFTNKSKK